MMCVMHFEIVLVMIFCECKKWYIQTSVLLFYDMVRWIFCLKFFFEKGFQLLMMIAKKFYVSSLFSHPTDIDVKIKPFLYLFFCFGSFFMDTHVSPVIDILNFFVTLGFYFGLHNSVIGILEHFSSNFYFADFLLPHCSCITN